jgi:hypothetical protein
MKTNTFRISKKQDSLILFTVTSLATAVLILAIVTISFDNQFTVNAQQQNTTKTGTFNHTQTDASGNPDWINTGNWSLTGVDSSLPTFKATIDMVRPDGSAAHEHEVSNLVVSAEPTNQNNSTVIEGITTITMREGPVADEPTTITLSGKDITVYFDPVKIDDHFGNQSITGSVS